MELPRCQAILEEIGLDDDVRCKQDSEVVVKVGVMGHNFTIISLLCTEHAEPFPCRIKDRP